MTLDEGMALLTLATLLGALLAVLEALSILLRNTLLEARMWRQIRRDIQRRTLGTGGR